MGKDFLKRKWIIAVAVAAVLLIPRPYGIDDGGSVEYASPLYSVTKYHRMIVDSEHASVSGYEVGWNVKIWGVTVYHSTSLSR